jgi:hypothetical protein
MAQETYSKGSSKNGSNDCKASTVLLSCILLIIVVFIVYRILLFINDRYINKSLDPFISKRDMRMNVYKKYSQYDPDENMNNDNQLLRYLDK